MPIRAQITGTRTDCTLLVVNSAGRGAKPITKCDPCEDQHAIGSMLLCLSRWSCDISWSHFGVLEKDVELAVCWVADKTGMGVRDGTQALIRSRQQQVRGEAGDGRRIVRRPAGSRQPIIGSGRPRSFRALAAGRAEVAVDLAGDVTLQAADDLRLGFPFGGAALGVGAGGRVRAQPGEHDPPQGMVGLTVTAGVEPVAGDFPR